MTKDNRKYADRRRYLIEAVSKRRKAVRDRALEYKGGKCEICGYSKCRQALEFHHLDGNKKDFGVSSRGYSRSWNKVIQEIGKCLLVCANCHRELHSGSTQLPKEISE